MTISKSQFDSLPADIQSAVRSVATRDGEAFLLPVATFFNMTRPKFPPSTPASLVDIEGGIAAEIRRAGHGAPCPGCGR